MELLFMLLVAAFAAGAGVMWLVQTRRRVQPAAQAAPAPSQTKGWRWWAMLIVFGLAWTAFYKSQPGKALIASVMWGSDSPQAKHFSAPAAPAPAGSFTYEEAQKPAPNPFDQFDPKPAPAK